MTTLPLTPHKREVLRAWLDGRTIQSRLDAESDWVDYLKDAPQIIRAMERFDDSCYRIKPTTARRFWKQDEIPVGWSARRPLVGHMQAIISGWTDGLTDGLIVHTSVGASITEKNYLQFEVATPGPANSVTWVPAGVEE